MKASAIVLALVAVLATVANADVVRARGALGVTMTRTGSARVIRVSPNSPAAQAGLLPGDKIVAIGDENITNFQDVVRIVSSQKPGTKVEIVFERGDLQGDVDVMLGSELDAWGTPATTGPARSNDNPEWPASYQPSRMESMPYQS